MGRRKLRKERAIDASRRVLERLVFGQPPRIRVPIWRVGRRTGHGAMALPRSQLSEAKGAGRSDETSQRMGLGRSAPPQRRLGPLFDRSRSGALVVEQFGAPLSLFGRQGLGVLRRTGRD